MDQHMARAPGIQSTPYNYLDPLILTRGMITRFIYRSIEIGDLLNRKMSKCGRPTNWEVTQSFKKYKDANFKEERAEYKFCGFKHAWCYETHLRRGLLIH